VDALAQHRLVTVGLDEVEDSPGERRICWPKVCLDPLQSIFDQEVFWYLSADRREGRSTFSRNGV
jgi:hypothetical protein